MEEELKNFEARLKEISKKLLDEFLSIRTNRPTTKLVEDIKIDYYGEMIPIKASGTVSIIPPREIVISVWDKNALGPISKAIETSGIGLTPNIDGNTIRLNLPPLTNERRDELIKLIKRMAEDERIKVRRERDEIMREVKIKEDAGEVNESERFKLKEKIQKIVDSANGEIEKMLTAKIEEIHE
ncbi:MAG TPA: ribosome recycling factor [Candidatus Paceibacterota bacterium]